MTRKKHDPAGPGNDGRWFLEAAGVVEPPPSPTSTYTQLETLDAVPAVDVSQSASTSAGAAAVSGSLAEDAPEGEFVPVSPGHTGPLDDWKPDDVSPGLNRRGWGRWVLGVLVLLVLGGIAAAFVLVPRTIQEQADVLASDYRESLTDLRNELPNTQNALAALTDPTTSPTAVTAAVPFVGDLNVRATVVIAQATEPLPNTVPFVPRDPFLALGSTRESMLVLGAEAQGISGRLATTFTYRSTVPLLFKTGELPTSAVPSTIDALSVSLAESLADTGGYVADLPDDPTFAKTKDLATSASERYATWQLEYLDALRTEDTERAAALVEELDAARTGIVDAMQEALDQVRSELDPSIVDLAGETERTISEIP